MQKSMFAGLFVGGVGAAIWGIKTMTSFGADVSRAIKDETPPKTVYLLVGGSAAAVVGLLGVLLSSRSK